MAAIYFSPHGFFSLRLLITVFIAVVLLVFNVSALLNENEDSIKIRLCYSGKLYTTVFPL